LGHQAARVPTQAEMAAWRTLWRLLSTWYGRPSSETFSPATLLPSAKPKRGSA
jgi:hypothetical protein